ncbi:MAG: CPBP family intramembrane glutamic endopeptidase [Candidatus Thorarchaeota archaeon]|jgi:membrane protease YdiL (CAAX protease family)
MNIGNREKLLRVVLYVFIAFLIVAMTPFIAGPLEGSELYELVGTLLFFLTFILTYLAVYTFVRWEGGTSVSDLGINLDDRDTFPHLVIGLVAGAAAVIVVVLLALTFGGELRPVSEIGENVLANVIVVTVPTAIFEELSHRGYLMPRMVELWGKNKGIIISSAFFASLHFGWWIPLGTIPYHLVLLFSFNMFLGGVVLSFSYFWSGNKLWVPIGFHFAWNMVAYIAFPSFPTAIVTSPELYQIEWGLTTIPGFLFGLSLIWMLLYQLKLKK